MKISFTCLQFVIKQVSVGEEKFKREEKSKTNGMKEGGGETWNGVSQSMIFNVLPTATGYLGTRKERKKRTNEVGAIKEKLRND